jgi:hypothetical protein
MEPAVRLMARVSWLATTLMLAQRARSRYRSHLDVLDDAAYDPAFKQPQAVVSAFAVACAQSGTFAAPGHAVGG